MMETFTFQVEGLGEFPYDMLRYDCCFPLTPNDSNKLTGKERRVVTLTTIQENRHWEPTIARWASFLWAVKVEVP